MTKSSERIELILTRDLFDAALDAVRARWAEYLDDTESERFRLIDALLRKLEMRLLELDDG